MGTYLRRTGRIAVLASALALTLAGGLDTASAELGQAGSTAGLRANTAEHRVTGGDKAGGGDRAKGGEKKYEKKKHEEKKYEKKKHEKKHEEKKYEKKKHEKKYEKKHEKKYEKKYEKKHEKKKHEKKKHEKKKHVVAPGVTPVVKPAVTPVTVARVVAAPSPVAVLPTGAAAGQVDTSGQLVAGGLAGMTAFLMLGAGSVLRRRRGEV
jgi:outer membrane biosynthesis protein TonB